MKRYAIIFLSAVIFLAGCTGSVRDIKVSDFTIDAVTPCGLRGLDAVIGITVDNPAAKFNVRGSQATIRMGGDALLRLSSDSLTVFRRGVERYHIPVHGELDGGFSIFSALPLLQEGIVSQCTVDMEFIAGIGKLEKKLNFNDIPLQKILNRF